MSASVGGWVIGMSWWKEGWRRSMWSLANRVKEEKDHRFPATELGMRLRYWSCRRGVGLPLVYLLPCGGATLVLAVGACLSWRFGQSNNWVEGMLGMCLKLLRVPLWLMDLCILVRLFTVDSHNRYRKSTPYIKVLWWILTSLFLWWLSSLICPFILP